MPVKERKIRLTIVLDDVAMARLMEVADLCHQEPELIASSMISDVLEDDATAHEGQVPKNVLLN